MEGELYLPMLPRTSRQAHIFPNIKHSLVSIGALCGAGCISTFRIKDVMVMYQEKHPRRVSKPPEYIVYSPLEIEN